MVHREQCFCFGFLQSRRQQANRRLMCRTHKHENKWESRISNQRKRCARGLTTATCWQPWLREDTPTPLFGCFWCLRPRSARTYRTEPCANCKASQAQYLSFSFPARLHRRTPVNRTRGGTRIFEEMGHLVRTGSAVGFEPGSYCTERRVTQLG